jgi:hypothetical protein
MLREGRRDGGSLVRWWGGDREFLSFAFLLLLLLCRGGRVDRVGLMIDIGLNSVSLGVTATALLK